MMGGERVMDSDTSFVMGAIVMALAIFIFFLGAWMMKESIADQCTEIGKFRYNHAVYECRHLTTP